MPITVFPDDTAQIVAELTKGNCIGLPTETVFGLAADATNGEAVARIFEMKGRPKFNPLIAHVSGIEMAMQYGVFNHLAEMLADKFWPGPLTLVLPLIESSEMHPLVTAGLGTVALRSPNGIAGDIIEQFGRPLAAPSANRSGRVSPTCVLHVAEEFSLSNLMIVEGPSCVVGIESTIVKIEGDELTVLRPGAITTEMITEATNIIPVTNEEDGILAPGMMKSHYAPNAKLLLNQTSIPVGATVLAFGFREKANKPRRFFNLSSRASLREAAANLYNGMKLLDVGGVETIYVQPIPMEGLGIAINDRLSRAAAPRERADGNE